tara:strand:- start:105 stop:386 length:282 start_codon:yes stop_codon:yes gene_type:complete
MAHILPNDIIMRIIREADGGRDTHKKKFAETLARLDEVQPLCDGFMKRLYGEEEVPDSEHNDLSHVFFGVMLRKRQGWDFAVGRLKRMGGIIH